MRGFRRIESALPYPFAVRHNLNQPLSLVQTHAQKTGLVCLSWVPHVLQIAKTINFAQVFKSIVLLVAVYVIDVFTRPFTRHVQPRQTMCQPFLIADSNCPVAGTCSAARSAAYEIWTALVGFPHKNARSRVVVQNRSHMVSGSHDLHLTIKGAA